MCGPPVQYTKYLHALTIAGATSSLRENITRNNKCEWELGISRVDEYDLQQLWISRVNKRVRVAEPRETTNVISWTPPVRASATTDKRKVYDKTETMRE